MGLFSSSRTRRARHKPAPEDSNGAARASEQPGPACAPGRPAAGHSKPLREALQQLYSIRPNRDAFAEEAAKLIASGAGIKAAALMGYEQRQARVRLLASSGLEPEAIQVLSGDMAVSSWDIPLRSLRSRRINVIESAHDNPFVPKALTAISPRRLTIAVLPFYHANSPVGVVVLFSPTQRGFADGLLQMLSQALRVCAVALADLPVSPAADSAPAGEMTSPEQPNLLRGLAALKGELARLTQALEEAERQRATEVTERVTAQSFLQAEKERTALLEKELATLREGREQLPALEEQVRQLNERLHGAVVTAESAQAELTRLQEALAGAQVERDEMETVRAALAEAQHEHAGALVQWSARIRELETEQSRLQEELAGVRGESDDTVSRLRNETEAAERECRQLSAQLTTLENAETECVQLRERAEELDHTVATFEARSRELDCRVEELSQANGRLIAERRDLQARIDTFVAGEQTLEQETQVTINAAQHRVTALEAELSQITCTLESTRARASEEVEHLKAERDDLSDRVEAESIRADELCRVREEALGRIASLESELHTTRDELLTDATARFTAEQEARHAAEIALRSAEERHKAEAAALTNQLEKQQAEAAGQLALLSDECERLVRTLAEKDLLLQSAEEGLTTMELAEAGEEADDTMLAIDRSGAPEREDGEEIEGESADEVEEAVADEVVLIDEDEIGGNTARQLAEFGYRITSLAPDPESTCQLGDRQVACAAINLAVPTAWRMLRGMRNGAGVPRMPLIAYALAANSPKGFWLGPVDFAVLPTEGTQLAETLNRMVPRVKRVIAMSNDIDVMSDARTQLTSAGISTAVVLDGRQALDLVSTVRPEAAVLHLSPSCVDVFRAIAGLRNSEISHEIPILFLMDADAQPREEAFLTAGVRMLSGRGDLIPGNLVDTLASALGPYRAG